MKLTPCARFWARVEKTGTCWIWRGCDRGRGYRTFRVNGKHVSPHRFSYEIHFGAIPVGLTIDHLCRNRACVRPEHLEAVTRRENVLRGHTLPAANRGKTQCPAGHPYDAANTYQAKDGRHCRSCNRQAAKLYQRARRARRTR